MGKREPQHAQILKKRALREDRGILSKLFRWLVLIVFFMVVAGAVTMTGIFFYLSEYLPRISSLADYHPPGGQADTDDRQHHVVPHTGLLGFREQSGGRGGEELHCRAGFQGGGVEHVDNHVGALEGSAHTVSTDSVDP